MIDSLAAAITLLALLFAVVVSVSAAARRYRWARAVPVLAALQLAVVVQAVLAVVGLAGGHHPREPATFVAYLVVSVLLIPLLSVQTRRDDGPWAGGLVGVALVVLAVLVVRAETTWRPA